MKPRSEYISSSLAVLQNSDCPGVKKAGNSKGYGFVELESEDVAKIAAETMNSCCERLLKCHFTPPEKVYEEPFESGICCLKGHHIQQWNGTIRIGCFFKSYGWRSGLKRRKNYSGRDWLKRELIIVSIHWLRSHIKMRRMLQTLVLEIPESTRFYVRRRKQLQSLLTLLRRLWITRVPHQFVHQHFWRNKNLKWLKWMMMIKKMK